MSGRILGMGDILSLIEQAEATMDQEKAFESAAKLGSGEDSSQIIVRVPPRTAPEPGETVYVRIRPGQEHIFSASTGKRLPA